MCQEVVLFMSLYRKGLILTHTCTFSHIFLDFGAGTFFMILIFVFLPGKLGDGLSWSIEKDASSFDSSLFLLVSTFSGKLSCFYILGFILGVPMAITEGIRIFASELLLEESFGVIKFEVGRLNFVGLNDMLLLFLFTIFCFPSEGFSFGANGTITVFF